MTPDMWCWAKGHLSLRRLSQERKLRFDLIGQTPLSESKIPPPPAGLAELRKTQRKKGKKVGEQLRQDPVTLSFYLNFLVNYKVTELFSEYILS